MVLGPLSPVPIAPIALTAVLAAERIFELALTRRRLRGGRAIPSESARAFGALVAVHVALLVLPPLEALFCGTRASGPLLSASIAAALLAQGLRYWCVVALGRRWNARAAVAPSAGFVERGPYRWIRHPNYLAVLVEFSAVPLAFGAWRAWLLLNFLHVPLIAARIRSEERLLRGIPGYADRMGAKGRLLPRLRRRSV